MENVLVLHIRVVDTGETHEVELPSSTRVEDLKTALSQFGVKNENQILLNSRGVKLEGEKTIDYYSLFSREECVIFLFDKRRIDAPEAETLVLPLLVPEPEVVAPVQKLSYGDVDDSALVGVLASYEQKFRLQLRKAEVFLSAMKQRQQQVSQQLGHIETKVEGHQVALLHVQLHLQQSLQALSAFTSSSQYSLHSQLLEDFPNDMNRCRQTEIDKAAGISKYKVLLDCLPEERLSNLFQSCKREHENLKNRVLELTTELQNILETLEEEKRIPLDIELSNLRNFRSKLFSELSNVCPWNIFQADHHEAVMVLERTVKQMKNGELVHTDWTLCDQLETKGQMHDDYINLKFSQYNGFSRETLRFFHQSTVKAARLFANRMKIISSLQSRIRDAGHKLAIFEEATEVQHSMFSQLLYVHALPEAYSSSLEEMKRRATFEKTFENTLKDCNVKLKEIVDSESANRKAFLERFGEYVPVDLIPGLDQEVPDVIISDPRNSVAHIKKDPVDSLSCVIIPHDQENLKVSHNECEEKLKLLQIELLDKEAALQAAVTKLEAEQENNRGYRKRIENLEEKLTTAFKTIRQTSVAVSLEDLLRAEHEKVLLFIQQTLEELQPGSVNSSLVDPPRENISPLSHGNEHEYEQKDAHSASLLPQLLQKIEASSGWKDRLKAQLLRFKEMASSVSSSVVSSSSCSITCSKMSPSRQDEDQQHQAVNALQSPDQASILQHDTSAVPQQEIEKLQEDSAICKPQTQQELNEDKTTPTDRELKAENVNVECQLPACVQTRIDLATERNKSTVLKRALSQSSQRLKQVVHYHEKAIEACEIQLQTLLSRSESNQGTLKMTLALSEFSVGDLAMFFPAPNGYEAFHKDSPFFFLTDESCALFPEERKSQLCVVGKILNCVPKVASLTYNPHQLALGTIFHEITLEKIN